jgi:hypothetical protein
MESFLKFIKFSFFFVQVFDQSSSSFLHLMKSAFETFYNTDKRPIDFLFILGMPDVVRDEFFNCFSPLFLQKVVITHKFELVH